MAAGLGVGGGATPTGGVFQGNVRASGAVGALGLDALVQTTPLAPDVPVDATYPPQENMGWLGVRYRAYRSGPSTVEAGPSLRLGLPLIRTGQSTRLDLGGAVGGASGRGTWLLNAGAQVLLSGQDSQFPGVQPYFLGGGTYDLVDWLRVYGALDLHVLATLGDGQMVVPYGFSGGLEAGRTVFVSLSGWVGRAETVETKFAATGTLSLGFHLDEAAR